MGLLSFLRRFIKIEIVTSNGCNEKVRYGRRETAEAAAFQMNQKPTTHRHLEVYPCADHWHIGGHD